MPPLIPNSLENKPIIQAPLNLDISSDYFYNSKLVENFLGKEIRDHYYNLFKMETKYYSTVITDWETNRYF